MRDILVGVLVGTGISDDVLTERLALGGCGDVQRAVRDDPALIIAGEEDQRSRQSDCLKGPRRSISHTHRCRPMAKEVSAVDLDVPPAAPSEVTLKERSAVDLDEPTLKERSAADRNVPPAAPFEATLTERSAADRRVPPAASFEATMRERRDRHVPSAAPLDATIKDRSAIDRHVPPAAPFEATIKDRSTVDLDVPPPVSPASEWPTSRPSGWLTWWLTWRPHESSTPAELPMVRSANAQLAPTGTPMPSQVVAQPVVASFAANVRSPIPRRARTWIVVTALIVATIGGTVAFIYGATNDSATNATNLDAIGGDQ